MVTDDERRRVARELNDIEFYYPENLDSILRVDDKTWIPDLIAPTCDRDALLHVAGELDATSDTPVGSVTLSTHVLWDWFDRIRAACGEVANEQTKDPRQA